MGPSEVVVLGLLLGSLGAATCREYCGTGLPPAPGPAAPRSPTPGLRPRDPHPRLMALTPSVPAGSHSLCYFLTGMTDPGPGMPRFVIVGYVDDKIFGIYDSKSRTAQPIVEMLPQEDQEHWAAQTQKARGGERDFDRGLGSLPERYNKSGGECGGSCSAMRLGQELCVPRLSASPTDVWLCPTPSCAGPSICGGTVPGLPCSCAHPPHPSPMALTVPHSPRSPSPPALALSQGLTHCRRCLAVTSWRTAASEGMISMHLMGGTTLPLIWTR